MNQFQLLDKLKEFNIFSQKDYHNEAFSRNIGLFTESEQEMLKNSKIAIPGMGGVGGIHFITMVRTGIGNFNISDFDIYEPANINRQFGARVPDFGRPKMEVMKEQAKSINPFINISEFPLGIDKSNVDDFLDGVSVVIDSLDFFAFETRRMIFKRAREKGIYVITAGPLGFGSAMLVFSPYRGMGFDEYFNIKEDMKSEEKYLAFALGLAPKAIQFKYMDTSKVSFKSKKGPSLNIACQLCSGLAGTEAVKILLNRGKISPVPWYVQFDPYLGKYCKGRLVMGNKNPLQRIKFKVVRQMLKKNEPIFIKPDAPVLAPDDNIGQEVLYYIILSGIQAPSGDNVQPWKFECNLDEIVLYSDKKADESFFNFRQFASLISCGAVIENMKTAATEFGLDTQIYYYRDQKPRDLIPVARLSFSKKSLPKSPLVDSIWTRHTNRKPFKNLELSSSIISKLEQSLDGIGGAKLHLATEKARIRQIAKLVYKADTIRTERKDLHEHFTKMIRFTPKEQNSLKNGFPLKNLEAGLAGEFYLKATKPWKIMNFANRTGLGKLVPFSAYQGIVNSSAVGLIVVKGFDNTDFVQGGMALERLWLTITDNNLYLQPMTAITLFFLRYMLEGDKSFSDKHTKLLEKIIPEFKQVFPGIDLKAEALVMLFRIGKSSKIVHKTLRKDTDSFLKNYSG